MYLYAFIPAPPGNSIELLDAGALVEGGKSAPIATFPLSSVHGASAPGKGDLQIQFYEEVRTRAVARAAGGRNEIVLGSSAARRDSLLRQR